VAMRDGCDETLSNGRPAVGASHVGLDRSFVEKIRRLVSGWIDHCAISPGLRDIGTLLLRGVERLLLCVRPRLRRVPCISALIALT
jgi:hypothetical protein